MTYRFRASIVAVLALILLAPSSVLGQARSASPAPAKAWDADENPERRAGFAGALDEYNHGTFRTARAIWRETVSH